MQNPQGGKQQRCAWNFVLCYRSQAGVVGQEAKEVPKAWVTEGLKCQRRLDSVLRDSDWPCLGHVFIREPITMARVVEYQFGLMYSLPWGLAPPEPVGWVLYQKERIYYGAQASWVDSERPQTRIQVDFAAMYPAH